VKFEIEFNERGHFRIVHIEGESRKHGEWAGYEHLARIRVRGREYYAVSQYYTGTMQVETVFSITPHPTVLFFPPTEEGK
jgi:hypothetical protein